MDNYRLPANCVIVTGVRRSCICDLQNKKFHLIPNSLAELLNEYEYFNIDSLVHFYGTSNTEVLESYITALKKKFLIMNLNSMIKLPSLPKLKLDFRAFDNCFIRLENCEIDASIIRAINLSKAKHLHIIVYQTCSLDELKFLFSYFLEFKSIELYCETDASHENLSEMVETYLNIRRLFVFNSGSDSYFPNAHPDMGDIYYLTSNVRDVSCGNICQEYFSVNIESYNRANSVNNCLYGKLGIDELGDYCNCPFMDKRFGNVKDKTPLELLKDGNFTSIWKIRKDDIEICKICEFRYICSDCRAFIKDVNNIFSQPAKCTYNPYIAKWQGQEGYLSVEEWIASNENFD